MIVLGNAQAAPQHHDLPPPSSWNAHEAVRFALQHNPDSTIGRQRLLAAQAAIEREKSVMAPQLRLVSQYNQTTTPMYSFGNILNQGKFSSGIDFNDPGRTDNLNAGLQVGYRLFTGGRDLAGVETATAESDAAKMELAAVHARLAFEVVRAFHGISQADDIVHSNQAAVTAVSAALEVAKARHEAGVLLRDAVLDLDVQLSTARENLIQAQQALALARKIFLTLLGLEEGSADIATEPGPDQTLPPTTSCGIRFELQGIDAMILAAQAKVRQAKAGAYPTMDGFAGYTVEQGTVTGGTGDAWQAGVKLQYDLYDGQKTAAEVARAAAGLAELQGKRHKMTLAISLEVAQARIALRETEERLQVSEKAISQARESAEINRARFAEGVILSSNLIDAENRLTEAMIRRTIAQTTRRIAIAELRRATGLPQFDDLSETPPVEEVRCTH